MAYDDKHDSDGHWPEEREVAGNGWHVTASTQESGDIIARETAAQGMENHLLELAKAWDAGFTAGMVGEIRCSSDDPTPPDTNPYRSAK